MHKNVYSYVHSLPMDKKPTQEEFQKMLDDRPKSKRFSFLWFIIKSIIDKEFRE